MENGIEKRRFKRMKAAFEYNYDRNLKEVSKMNKKYHLELDDYEHSLLIHALNDKRNELIQNGS